MHLVANKILYRRTNLKFQSIQINLPKVFCDIVLNYFIYFIYQLFMRSNRKKVINFHSPNYIIYKLFLLHNRNLVFPKDWIFYLSLFCIFACFFVEFIETNTKYWKHIIIEIEWADEIN